MPCQIPNVRRQALDSVVKSKQLPSQVWNIRIGREGCQISQGIGQNQNAVQVRKSHVQVGCNVTSESLTYEDDSLVVQLVLVQQGTVDGKVNIIQLILKQTSPVQV